jgi:hypothetical protein
MITDVAITGLTKAMDSLKGSIESAFAFAQRAEKSSMALGMSFGQASDQLGGTMKGLRGDLNERFAGAIAGLEAGLQGNTAGIGRLVNQQRLTGTASAKTAEAFAKMEMTMGLSRETTNQLASNMVELGAEFQISTDNLVGAINMMAESFPAQKLAGMGAEVNEAVATLQAELGPSMSGPLNSVMKMVMDTSMQGYENLTKLGIGNVREQLAAAKDSSEANRILKDAIAIASRNFKDVVGDASEGFFQVGVASEIFGKSALDIVTVQDAFGQRVKVEGEQTADFGNQLSVVKDEILVPLQEAFLEFFPIIKNVAMIIGTNLKEAVEFLVIRGMRLYLEFGGLEGIVQKAKEKFTQLKDYFTKTLLPAVMKFKDVALVGLGVAIVALTAKLTIMMVTALLPLTAAIAAVTLTIVYWDQIVSFVKNTLIDFASFIGNMMSSLGDMLGWFGAHLEFIGDTITDVAESLRDDSGGGSASPVPDAQKNAEAEKAAKDRESKKKTDEEILKAFNDQMEMDTKLFGFNEQTAKNTEELNRKTPEIETSSQFLDETANMLGRSIEAILGIGVDDTQSKILEAMEATAAATTKTAEQEGSGGGGGVIPTT